VTRVGQQLTLDGAPYRFAGVNVWRANVASWNRPPNTSYTVNDGTVLDTTLKDIHAGGARLNVVRAWFFQQFALRSGVVDWSAFDKTLQVAQANGFKVIATLADQWSYEGPAFKDASWYESGYANAVATPYEIEPYRQYVRDVVSRYKDNPTILAWELVNEPDVAVSEAEDGTCVSNAEPILASFVHDVGGLIKSIDPNHLVSLGAAGNGMCGTIEGDYQQVMSDPSIDLCSFHDYYGATNAAAYDPYNGLNVRVRQCAALNKPIYVGESGIHAKAAPCYGDLSCRAGYLQQKLSAAFAMQGMVGYLPWLYDDRGYISDDYVYGPGDPGLPVLAAYATP
jgi:endo-1,4-beta-mannosidase